MWSALGSMVSCFAWYDLRSMVSCIGAWSYAPAAWSLVAHPVGCGDSQRVSSIRIRKTGVRWSLARPAAFVARPGIRQRGRGSGGSGGHISAKIYVLYRTKLSVNYLYCHTLKKYDFWLFVNISVFH